MDHFRLTFFNRPHFTRDGVERTLRSSKFLALLAYLTNEESQSYLRTDLASLFWPETSEQAGLQNLRQAVYQWLQAFSNSSHSEKSGEHDISAPFLQITRSTIQFCPNGSVFVDTLEFVKAVQVGKLEQAAELYQGEFLAGFVVKDSLALEEWLLRSRAKYHQMVMKALHTLADQHLTNGEYPSAQRSIGRQLVLEPWNEPAHRQKMSMLTQTGQKEAALAQFELCQQILQKRFASSPTQETLDLYHKIRIGQFSAPVSRPDPHPICPPRLLNFPRQETTFFGRETEQLRVQEWLSNPQNRLITIVGEGGSGKTRLAIQIAERLASRFEHGTVFIPLARVGMELPMAGVMTQRPDRQEEILTLIATALRFTFQEAIDLKSQVLSYLAPKKILLVLDNFEHLRCEAYLLLDIFQQAPGVVMLVTSRQRLNFQGEHLLHLGGLPVPSLSFSKTVKARRIFSKEGQHSLTAGSVQLFVERARRVSEAFILTPSNLPVVIEICRFLNGNPLGIELAAAQVEMFDCEIIADRLRGQTNFLQTQMGDLPARHQSLRTVLDWMTANAHLNLALNYSRQGQVAQGWEYSEKALSVLRRMGDEVNLANLLGVMAYFGSFLMHPEAMSYVKESLEMYRSLEDAWGIAISTNYLATVALSLGDYDLAEKNFQLFLAQAQDLGSHRMMATATSHLELVYLGVGKYREAYDLCLNGLELQETQEVTPDYQSLTMGVLGYAEYHLGMDKRIACEHLEEAFAIGTRLNHPISLVIPLLGLGEVALAENRLEQAREFYLRALSVSRNLSATYFMLDALIGAARVQIRMGNPGEAQKWLSLALGHPVTSPSGRRVVEKILNLDVALLSLREAMTRLYQVVSQLIAQPI